MKKSVENLTYYLREATIGRYFVASWQIKDTLAVYCTICDRGVLVFAQIQVFSRHLGRFDGKKRPRCITEAGKNTRQIFQIALHTKPCELQPKESRSPQRSTRLFVYRSICLLCATEGLFMANVSLNSISARIRAVFLAIKWILLRSRKIDYKAFITQNDNPNEIYGWENANQPTFYVEPIFATYFAEWADKRGNGAKNSW